MKTALLLAAVALSVGTAIAEDPAATSAPASQTATAPVESAGQIDVADLKAWKAAVGKSAVAAGTVAKVTVSPGGSIVFVDFKNAKRGDFVAIIKKENKETVDKGFDGDVAKAIAGKYVLISGIVTDYKGAPQLEISKPDQIKISEPPAPPPTPATASAPAAK